MNQTIKINLPDDLRKTVSIFRIQNDLDSDEAAVLAMLARYTVTISHQLAQTPNQEEDGETTLAQVIHRFLRSNCHAWRRPDLIRAIYEDARRLLPKNQEGLPIHSKGKIVDYERVDFLLGRIMYDMKRRRPGWWSEFQVHTTGDDLLFERVHKT